MSTSKQSKTTSWRALALAAAAAMVMAGAMASASTSGAFAAAGAVTSPPGAVVSVSGGTFLWVADEQGVLHLVGDTRALAGRPVDWSKPAQVTVDQLQGASRGDPWLSLPLVKIGDAIYLPKWETTAPTPTLYHVQSAADLTLLGLTGQNYGQLVRDKATWEQQFGLSTDSLQRAELPPVVPPATTAAPATTSTPSMAAAAANAARGAVGHLPQWGASTANGANSTTGVGGDVTFDIPSGRGWSDASNVDRLNDVIPLGTLDNEKTLAQWRVLTRSGGAYTYLQVKTFALWSHPDIDTAQDLAELKLRFLCRDVNTCTVQPAQQAVIAGVPASIVDATFVRQFGEQRSISGVSTDEGDKNADQLTWSTRDVFLVKGDYGYDIRLASTDTLTTRVLADLDQALATLQFHY